MTFDEYSSRIAAVFAELKAISELTEAQAWAQTADTSSAAFRSLMTRHAQLTKLAAEMNERMLGQMGTEP